MIGDITKGHFDCSLDVYHELQQQVTHLFHLAAIYDLAVEEKLARLVNVVGPKQVNEWAKGVTGLKRYTYFSTAYVAGMREGCLYEDELKLPKSFKNHYERTKCTKLKYWLRSLKKKSPLP